MAQQALSDITVIDLTHHVAGPYCTRLLASFGAQVIKVERPDGGDPARRRGPFPDDVPHPERSSLFLHLNTGKRGATLNLKTTAGKKLLEELVTKADILVENFAPRVMPSLGLGYERLAELNPRLIMTSIANFGSSGPYRDWRAANITLLAMGGLMYVTGQSHREPLAMAGAQAEYLGGQTAFTATMAALYAREVSGQGAHVEVSLMEAVAASLEHVLPLYSFLGAVRRRSGGRHLLGYPRDDLMPCQDGHVAVGPASYGMESLALLMERPELAEDPLFQDGRLRQERADEFEALLGPWLATQTRAQVLERAQELRVPLAPVLSPGELLDDPQLVARGFFVSLDHPEAGPLPYVGNPFTMSETPGQLDRAPLLGEHNHEVFCQGLGLSPEDLVRLREQGII